MMSEQTADMVINVLVYATIISVIATCSYYAGKHLYTVQKKIDEINQKKKDV